MTPLRIAGVVYGFAICAVAIAHATVAIRGRRFFGSVDCLFGLCLSVGMAAIGVTVLVFALGPHGG